MQEPAAPLKKWKTFLGYGSGDYALNLFWQGTGFYLFFFYANVAGLPTTLIGAIFLVASIWDAISDPVMGYLAERTSSRWGPYRPYLLFGAIPLSLSFVLLFTPVEINDDVWKTVYFLGVLLLFRTCYTIVSIPYSALSARVTRNSDARTKLAGIRMYFGFLGGISISFFAKTLQETYSDAEAFHYMGIGAAFFATFILYICFKNTKESANPINEISTQAGIMDSLKSIAANKPFLLLIGGIMFVTVATTVIGQTLLFYFESQLNARSTGNIAIIIMTAAPLISIPLWASLTLKVGKRNAWILGSIIAVIGLVWLYFDTSKSPTFALVEITMVTFGLSAYALIFWSMLPDTLEYGEYQSSVHSESLLIGIASSFQKISIGLSAFVLGLLLDAVGYSAGVASSPTTTQGIKSIFSLIPIAALVVSSLLIFFYPITSKMHAQIVTALQKKIG